MLLENGKAGTGFYWLAHFVLWGGNFEDIFHAGPQRPNDPILKGEAIFHFDEGVQRMSPRKHH